MEVQTARDVTLMRRVWLVVNGLILAVGNCGGPLVMRLYYIRGGKRIWFSSWLETAGWPVILIPLLVSYVRRRKRTTPAGGRTEIFFMKRRLFYATVVMGLLIGLEDYLYAYGVAKLPLSTSAVIVASQLAFAAVFAYFLVKQKFTAFSVNSIVTLLTGAVVLAAHSSGDRPKGESNKEYWIGFFVTGAGAVLYGFLLPAMELIYLKAKQTITYTLVMEIQLVLSLFATIFCAMGMVINKDFQGVIREGKEFELGEAKYYVILVWSAILWQCFYLGAIGVIYYASSLLSAIIIHALLPVTELLAVAFYHEPFRVDKGISLFLCLWGFTSYFYGEIKHSMKEKEKEKNSPSRDRTPAETQLDDIP